MPPPQVVRVRLCICESVREYVFCSLLYLLNGYSLPGLRHINDIEVNGSKVKVSQRRPQKSCERDSF